MNRSIQTTNYGEGFIRHTVRIEADPSPEDGQEGYRALAMFIQSLAGMPDLLRHVGPCPQSLTFTYDNGCWFVEATTIVARPPDEA